MKKNYLKPELLEAIVSLQSVCAASTKVDEVIIDEEEIWNAA